MPRRMRRHGATPIVMVDLPLPWSESAQTVMMAIRLHAEHTNGLPAPVLLGAVRDTPPGLSAIARALRNDKIWPNRGQVASLYSSGNGYRSGSGIEPVGTEAEAERRARSENAWEVGERHILAAIGAKWFQDVGVQTEALSWAVQVAELGPSAVGEVSGRWHGLIDSNVVLQFHDLKDIDWIAETRVRAVTLWVGVSLLNELEHLKYESGSRRARDRAARFTKEIGRMLDELLAPAGKDIRSGVKLRLWSAPGVTGMRDEDHLQTARTLRIRGVPIVVVTADVGVRARARLAGFDVLEPSDQWVLKKELTPSEREVHARLASAGISLPPNVRLTFEPPVGHQGSVANRGWLMVKVDELGVQRTTFIATGTMKVAVKSASPR